MTAMDGDAHGPLLGGIDIGGTKIGLCIGTPDGRVLAADRLAVDPEAAPEDVLRIARDKLLALAGTHALAAVGCPCPGPLDYKAGRFINPPNNPRWHGFGLRDWLHANLPCPAEMMNDANAAALAEWLWGGAMGTSSSIFLTMSTGMGSGMILDNRLYEGPLGLAGEIGRLRLSRADDDGPVGFGRRGSAEGYCSGPGMAQLAESEALVCTHRRERTMLHQALAEHGRIRPEDLCRAALAGDPAPAA